MSKKPASNLLSISTDMVAGVMVGLLCGFYLDKWLETKPLLIIICLIIGILAGFRMIWREMKNK